MRILEKYINFAASKKKRLVSIYFSHLVKNASTKNRLEIIYNDNL